MASGEKTNSGSLPCLQQASCGRQASPPFARQPFAPACRGQSGDRVRDDKGAGPDAERFVLGEGILFRGNATVAEAGGYATHFMVSFLRFLAQSRR